MEFLIIPYEWLEFQLIYEPVVPTEKLTRSLAVPDSAYAADFTGTARLTIGDANSG